jgi:hypothetical protein
MAYVKKKGSVSKWLKLRMVEASVTTCLTICDTYVLLFNEGNEKRIYIIKSRPVTYR